VSRGARRLALITVAVTVAFLATTNGAVRSTGGNPSWLSVAYTPEKISALSALVTHAPRHLAGACDVDLKATLVAAAKRNRISSSLLRSIARAESSGSRHAISRAGAMGVMQLTGPTAEHLGVTDPFDVAQNIDAGARYVAWLSKRYRGDRRRIVAAYNVGPGRVPRRGALRLPGETRHYVARVLSRR